MWRVGSARFDETNWSLLVDDRPVELEAKPLAVLHELLLRAGETLTKTELLDAVWHDRDEPVGEASLASAVSKLRRALGDASAAIVVTVPTVGYRLGVPVTVEQAPGNFAPRHAFRAGEPVAGRPQWRLLMPLGSEDVWRARHDATGDTRVFRFADTPDGLTALKRDIDVHRRLARVADGASCFAAVLEWSFEAPPFFVEYADGGEAFPRLVERQGGFACIPPERRIDIVAGAASALAKAHDVGVLHTALDPGDIVIDNGGVVRLVGFGDGRLIDDDDTQSEGEPDDPADGLAATPFRAPELRPGAPPTRAADIFAMGVILYQAIVGEFGRPLAPNWDMEVADLLLVADIAAAASSDPARRLKSADDLVERLRTLPDRHVAAARARDEAARLASAQASEQRRRMRAPWVRAAAIAIIAGLVATTAATFFAVRSRNVAIVERSAAVSAYRFLADDLLARVSPSRADAAEETLTDAVLRARAGIDRRFRDHPLVAARLHHSLAGALHQRSRWNEARVSYHLADADFARASAPNGMEAAENRMSLALTEAASAQPGSLDRARRLVAAERSRDPAIGNGPAGVKLHQTEGLIAYFGDPTPAPDSFTRAADLAEQFPERFTASERLQLRQAAGMALLRTGQAARAVPILNRTAERLAALKGADHPDALLARGSALTAATLAGHHAEVVPAITALLPSMQRRFGLDHRYSLAMLSLRSQALVGLGRLSEAARDADTVWRTARQSQGPGQQTQVAELELAEIQCGNGQIGNGLSHARSAHGEVLKTSGRQHPLTHTAAFILGECLTASGNPDQALALYGTVDPALVGQQVADGDWKPNLQLARAEALHVAGDTEQARREIRFLDRAFQQRGSEWKLARVARLRVAMGDP